jgi:hypothetical protein
LKLDTFTLEAMVQHLRNGEAEWCSFDASSPEVVGLEGGLGLKKLKYLKYLKVMKANGAHINQVRQRLWMRRLMHLCRRLCSNFFWNEEAEWFSFDASSPDDVGPEEGSLVEDTELSGSDEGKWCITYLSVP